MTNPREEKIKITESGVITEEALLAYLHDQLSPEDRHEMERLLKEDPFAQEAFEGLKSTQNKVALSDSLKSIRKKVHHRMDKKDKKIMQIHWTNYAWAAVILGLLISLGIIMIAYLGKRNEGQMSVNNKPQSENIIVQKNEEPSLVQTPAANSDTVPVTASTSAPKQIEQPASKEKVVVKDQTPVVKPGSNNNFTKSQTGAVVTTKDTSFKTGLANVTTPPTEMRARRSNADLNQANNVNNAIVNKGNMSASSPTTFTANESNQNPDNKIISNEVEQKQVTLQEATKTFFGGDYKVAESQFDQVLKQQPESPEALFFGGISDYVNGNLKKAEPNFDKLLKQHKKYTDGAKWYKANILLKEGDKQRAKKMLEELSESGGSYKERAQKKLSETPIPNNAAKQ